MRPTYARRGIGRRLIEGLAAIRADEVAKGLDAWPRVVMRQRLGSGG